eukprot:658712-Rhodomonas_salina.1
MEKKRENRKRKGPDGGLVEEAEGGILVVGLERDSEVQVCHQPLQQRVAERSAPEPSSQSHKKKNKN